MNEKPIPVIYIAGVGHSGSTLLNLLLGSHSKIEGKGELNTFKAVEGSTKCSCGATYDECAHWTAVRDRIVEINGKELDAAALNTRRCADFQQANYQFIKTILDVSGKEILCESSKYWPRLGRLLDSELFDVLVIHIIRDGRAVGYSQWKKDKGYYKWVLDWNVSSLRSCLRLRRIGAKRITVRYEDIVGDPEKYLSLILGRLGLSFEKAQLDFSAKEHHILRGNSTRHRKGQAIAHDSEYLAKMSFSQKILGTLLGCPALMLFRYALWLGMS